MANVANLPADNAGAVAPGMQEVGKHISGGNGVTVDVTTGNNKNGLLPDLIKTNFDDTVVKMGWSTTPINAMTREMGYKPMKSMEYGYYSIDLRQVEDETEAGSDAIPASYSTTQPARLKLKVANADKFDVTDVIIIDGVSGKVAGVNLAARVCAINTAGEHGEISVQYLNAPAAGIASLAAAKKIYILGHAAGEIDASTTPYAALPNKSTQYMQKFMVQSLISSVMIESDKEVNWGKADIDELLMQQFVEDIEKTYIWGVKSYTFDTTTKMYTRTTSGIVEQLLQNGVQVVSITKSSFDTARLIEVMSGIFVGNSGSTSRYMFTGMGFATSLFGLTDIKEYVNANDTVRKFEFDFTKIKLFNNTLLNAPHPLFDKCGWTNYALVLDRQYVERRVFRSMDETALELKKTGAYDGESTVWSEISSVIVKYPKCHAILKLV